MSDSVAAAISGDADKATAFWAGIHTLKTEWKMEKADLCKFMSDGVAAAISGDADKATAFWAGIDTLKTEWKMEKADLCSFVCNGIASRLANNHTYMFSSVFERIGTKSAKTLLTKQPMLTVLPEFVTFMNGTSDDELMDCVQIVKKRKQLVEELKQAKRKKYQSQSESNS
jgi:hypothetical protein